jgi:hypothetical protein
MTPSTLIEDRAATLQDVMSSAADTLRGPTQALCFWVAVLLPFASLSLLADGLLPSEVLPLVGLLIVNGVALLAGHNYRR